MSVEQWPFLLVVFIAYIFHGITGFSGTLLSMPAGSLLLGLEPARAVLNAMSFASGGAMALAGLKAIDRRQLAKMVLWMLPGMALGFFIDYALPHSVLLPVYAVFLILLAVANLVFLLVLKRPLTLPGWAGVPVLVAAGAVQALYLTGGSLLVVYAASAIPGRAAFRSTLSVLWLILNGVTVAVHAATGLYTPGNLLLMAATLLPVAAGLFIGGRLLYRRFSGPRFSVLIYVLVLLSGASLLIG